VRRSNRIKRTVLALAAAAFTLPVLWTLLASFGMHPQTTRLPPAWTFPPSAASFGEVGVAEAGFWQELLASTGVSVGATALSVLIAFMGAYSLSRSRMRQKDMIAQAFLVLASIPVMAYAIPLDITIRMVRLHDTFIGTILAQAAAMAPLALAVFYGQLRQIPVAVEEAALLDGAGIVRTLTRIVVPMNAAGCAATAIVLFALSWNSLLIPMVVTTSHVRTLPLALSDFFVSDRELEWPTAAAALVVSLAPLVALIALAHRTLERFFLGTRQMERAEQPVDAGDG
jgi:ABC-type glycerol-3-phosphate transport system permease component